MSLIDYSTTTPIHYSDVSSVVLNMDLFAPLESRRQASSLLPEEASIEHGMPFTNFAIPPVTDVCLGQCEAFGQFSGSGVAA